MRDEGSTEPSWPKQTLSIQSSVDSHQRRAETAYHFDERDYFIDAQETPFFKRLIFKEDLYAAIRYLESQ
jgi:hypothetical protein